MAPDRPGAGRCLKTFFTICLVARYSEVMLSMIIALTAGSAALNAPDPSRSGPVRAQARIQVLSGYRLVSTREGLADRRAFRTVHIYDPDGGRRTLRIVEFE
jgi:hypothetical protein